MTPIRLISNSARLLCIVSVCMVSLIGCSASHLTIGQDHLENKEYDAAVRTFVLSIRADSTQALAWQGLGLALAGRGDTNLALASFRRALHLDPDNAETILLLGSLHEDRGEYAAALSYYRLYGRAPLLSETRSELEARLEYLTRRQLQSEAREALAQEAAIDVDAIPDRTVAVLPFRNLGQNRDLDPLEKGIAEMIITDLSKVRSLNIVERVRLQALLDEMGFSASEYVQAETGPRIGRLLGVATLVKGSLIDLDGDELRMDAALTRTKDGSFDEAGNVSGDLDRFFRLQKDLVFSVLDKMDVVPTEQERKEILTIPTQSLLAFMAYSRGLDLEDRGRFQEAQVQYSRAVSIDPQFRQAQERSRRSQIIGRGKMNRQALHRSMRFRRIAAIALRRRLQRTGQLVRAGVIPGKDLRRAYQEREGEQPFGLVPVEVTIPIP